VLLEVGRVLALHERATESDVGVDLADAFVRLGEVLEE